MVKIQFIPSYAKMLEALLKSNPTLRDSVDTSESRFRDNPGDTRLRTHALRKKLQGKHAFSVTDDIRIIFEWVGKTTARFLAIGPHKKVYGRKK